jgi:hypothetical protein
MKREAAYPRVMYESPLEGCAIACSQRFEVEHGADPFVIRDARIVVQTISIGSRGVPR